MPRTSVCAMLALIVFTGAALAAESTGKIKSVDQDKMTLTVTIDGKDVTYKFDNETKVVDDTDRPLASKLGASRFKDPINVTVTFEKKGDALYASKVKAGKRLQ